MGRSAYCAILLSLSIHSMSAEDLQGGLFQRIIIGAEGSGGAATTPTGRYFTDIFVSTPLFAKEEDTGIGAERFLGPAFRLWVDSRITSVPQQFDAKVSEFSIATGFKDLKVNQIAQSIEVLGGFQLRVAGQEKARKLFFDDRFSRTALSVIGSYGGTTPFVPTDFVAPFKMPDNNSDAYTRLRAVYGAELDRRPNATNVAFVPADHTRFWREYYAGFRVQSYFFADATSVGSDKGTTPPRTVDLVVGQNEVVTGGSWRGMVVRADFFQPVVNFGAKGTLYVFGTAAWKASVGPDATRDAIVLDPATGTVDLAAPTTLLLTAKPSNRDFFRFGIGFDLKKIFGM